MPKNYGVYINEGNYSITKLIEFEREEVDEEDLYRPTKKGGLDREIIDQIAENVNEELNKDMLKKEN